MRLAYATADIRAAEARAMKAAPADALMQRAAYALASRATRLLEGAYGRRVVLLVGSGNNGGDALLAGAELARRGARIDAVLVAGSALELGVAALRSEGGRIYDAAKTVPEACAALFEEADVVLDGMLGIGGRGGLRGTAGELAALLEHTQALAIAVDVPSGIDADTGAVEGRAVRADVTVTFGATKPGLLVDPAAEYAGIVDLVDIGLGDLIEAAAAESLQDADVAALLPQASAESTKYRRGVLGVCAGSSAYPGAAVLATAGALRTGVGMVRFVSASAAAQAVRTAWPEAVVTELADDAAPDAVLDAGQVQAWAIGPGLGTDERAEGLVRAVLGTDLPVVVDADALTVLARDTSLAGRGAPTLLTPHAGELARLLGLERADIEACPWTYARRAAAELGCVVLLKGSTTVIAQPDGRTRINSTGTPMLATAGSGDVLTGAAGTLLAAGLAPLAAGSVAAYLHGRAARLVSGGGAPVIARDVADTLPDAIRGVRG